MFARTDSPAIPLPCIHWGDVDAPRQALLVHGFQSCAATFRELGEHLSNLGWYVTACDMRGHGDAPRTSSYLLQDYVMDLKNVQPKNGRPWDLVVAHSLGGACSVRAASVNTDWAFRLVLLDPYLKFVSGSMEDVTITIEAGQKETVEDVVSKYPHWRRDVVEAKVWGQRQCDPEAIKQTLLRNGAENDLIEETARLPIPFLVIAGDPEHGGSVWLDGLNREEENLSFVQLDGIGHNPHRDKPDEVLELLRRWEEDSRQRILSEKEKAILDSPRSQSSSNAHSTDYASESAESFVRLLSGSTDQEA